MENNKELEENYSLNLGLSSDSPVYFSTPGRDGLIQQLTHLIFFGDGLSVVIGDAGIGKSCIAKELHESIDATDCKYLLRLNSEAAPQDLLVNIAEGFGVVSQGGVSLGEVMTLLRSFTQTLSQEGKAAVLLIDDAHHMDEQSLGALLSLLQGDMKSGAGLRVLCFSKPGLVDRIDALGLIDVPVYDFDVPSLSASEAKEFISFYADVSGIEVDDSDNPGHLWSVSKGIPGSIVSLLEKKYEGVGASTKNQSSGGKSLLPWGHGVALVVLLSALIWAYATRDSGDKVANNEIVSSPQQAKMNPSPSPTVQPLKPVVDRPHEPEYLKDEVYAPKDRVEQIVSIPDRRVRPTPEEMAKGMVGALKGESVQVANDDYQVEKPVMQELEVETPSENDRVEPKKEKTPLPVPTQFPVATPLPLTKDESFLLSLPESYFVLQILAASKKESLERFVESQPNKNELFVYRGVRQGKTWAIVVAGPYKSKNEALQARKKLPKKQLNAGPWPRKVASVQNEIDALAEK